METKLWVGLSEYIYFLDDSEQILNIAFPSAIASYYITIQPENKNVIYDVKFNTEKDWVLSSNISVYNTRGDPVEPNDPANMDGRYTDGDNMLVDSTGGTKIILMRFYVKRHELFEKYRSYSIPESWLPTAAYVSNPNNIPIEKTLPKTRKRISELLQIPIQLLYKISSFKKNNETDYGTGFFLGNQGIPSLLAGFFPDNSHEYIQAYPEKNVTVMKIEGLLPPNTCDTLCNTPYLDFMLCDISTSKTHDAIPFYELGELGENYVFYAANSNVILTDIQKLDKNCPDDAIILRWNPDIRLCNRAVLHRIIIYKETQNYSPLLANKAHINYLFDLPLSPQLTRGLFRQYYPKITYFEQCH
jgi:hypothetical protein